MILQVFFSLNDFAEIPDRFVYDLTLHVEIQHSNHQIIQIPVGLMFMSVNW